MYEGRESRDVWYVSEYDYTPTFTAGYAINETFPENPGPDEVLFIPGYGSTSSFWATFGEAHENALVMIERDIENTKSELRRLEKRYLELLNPDFWKHS